MWRERKIERQLKKERDARQERRNERESNVMMEENFLNNRDPQLTSNQKGNTLGDNLLNMFNARTVMHPARIEDGTHLKNTDRNKIKLCFAITNARSLCCLLYTSPSPRDLSTSRMPSSA